MDDRLREAKQWVSKKLSNDEAAILNRAMGIEDEVMKAIALEDNDNDNISSKKKDNKSKGTKGIKGISTIESQSSARVKGFLQLNTHLCSGCGTAFQSKSPDEPGYLPKDKLIEHRMKSVNIKEKQEAIKILDMAGIDIGSNAAEQILLEANISPQVIAGIKSLGEEDNYFDDQIDDDDDDDDDEDDDSEYDDDDYDDDDILDGLEIDITEDMITGKETIQDATMKAIKDKIALAGSNTDTDFSKISQEVLSPVKGIKEGTIGYVNDINDEVNPQKIDNGIIFNKKVKNELKYLKSRGIKGTMDIDSKSSVLDESICICQRCFRLQQYGQVEQNLRPGWSSNELLTPQRFESLLSVIRENKAIVLYIIDVFDLRGSLLRNLKQIAGSNPIVIAANKADLLPKDMSSIRITNWIHSEIKLFCDLRSPREIDDEHFERIRNSESSFRRPIQDEEGILRRANVHLVSCQSGMGTDKLISSLMAMAQDNGKTIYVMGAANVGKSSFINRLLDVKFKPKSSQSKKQNVIPQATVSNLPGTTLDFLKIRLPNEITMIDTPGLINNGQLTSKLTTEELKQVIPSKPINAVTLRLNEGKCVMIGGMATIELLEGRPFFFTFFVSNEIKLHPTDSIKVEENRKKHLGTIISPPASYDRLVELGLPFEEHIIEIAGEGWRKSSTDIVIAGLGWVSITGTGLCKVKVSVPQDTSIGTRPSLLPYEAPRTTAKFTG
jgi:ribosome biogenesis GTPase A